MSTLLSILAGVPVGILSSLLAWWILFHRMRPRLLFSDVVSKVRGSDPSRGHDYRVKFLNAGRRAIVDLEVFARLTVPAGDLVPVDYVLDIPVNAHRIPRLDTKDKPVILRLELRRATAIVSPIFPAHVRARFDDGSIGLEDLLSLNPDARLEVLVFGYDEWSGARRLARSRVFRGSDVKAGLFQRGRSLDLVEWDRRRHMGIEGATTTSPDSAAEAGVDSRAQPKKHAPRRISPPGEISALIDRILKTPASSKDDHLGVDLLAEKGYAVASLERTYELILRYLNRANITKNADGVDIALHLLNASHTGVSALLLLLHGYPFQASILLRHMIEITALVQAACLDVQHWNDFHERRGKANYQKLLGVAQKVVPSIREIHGRLSNYSQHINPLQGSLPLAERVGDRVNVTIAGYSGRGLTAECSKVAKWLCGTLCHLEVAVERLTYEFAGEPRFWIKDDSGTQARFSFDRESAAWKEMIRLVDR